MNQNTIKSKSFDWKKIDFNCVFVFERLIELTIKLNIEFSVIIGYVLLKRGEKKLEEKIVCLYEIHAHTGLVFFSYWFK